MSSPSSSVVTEKKKKKDSSPSSPIVEKIITKNNDNKNEEEEYWFRNLSLWIICLCLTLDIGSISAEVWKSFLVFSANVAAVALEPVGGVKKNQSSSSSLSSSSSFDEQQYSNNLIQGIHVFALIAHLLIPIPIYLAARARYGSDQFLAWQPFTGGVRFIAFETGAFVLWVGGLVVRWSQIFTTIAVLMMSSTIISSPSSCGANPECQKQQRDLSYHQQLFVPPHPSFVQKSAHDFVSSLSQHLPESVVANMEILSDDPQVYHVVAFLVSPKIRTLISEISFSGLGRIIHSLGAAILFFYSLTAFSPENRNNNNHHRRISSNNNNTSRQPQNQYEQVAKNAYPGSLLSWFFKSGRVFSDLRENAYLCWNHNSVRGTIIAVLLTMTVTLYFLIAALLYVPENALDIMTSRHYVYFFLWKIPFPVLSKVILVMHVVCGLQAHFIFGLANVSGFTVFKPFVGPDRYIVMQMISWTIFGVAVVLYRAVAPSLEIFDVIPVEGWIAANVASLVSSLLLLVTSCCRFLYWNSPSLFEGNVRPNDVARVSLLFSMALLIFYGLFFILSSSPQTTSNSNSNNNSTNNNNNNLDLIEGVMRQLAICSVCIGPVAQTMVWLVIPVYNHHYYSKSLTTTTSNNSNNNNNILVENKNTSSDHVDATYTLLKKFTWMFFAAEVWVLALALLFVLPCSNESSAIVICLSIVAQAMYAPLLSTTCASAYTILAQFRQQEKSSAIASPSTPLTNNNKKSSPTQSKTNDKNNKTASSSPSPSSSAFNSPRVRRALSTLFLDLDERITVNGPIFLSFSLFAHSLIFRWTLAVISVSHLFIPVELAKLATFSFSGDFSRNASIIHQNSWSTLGSFGLACAFFATTCCVPMAHFCIRGLRGLVVNPFIGTPAFAATQVSSWISHLVCFAFLLYLLVNDLLSSSSSAWTSSSSPAMVVSRISFEHFSNSNNNNYNNTSPPVNFSQLKSRQDKDKIVRMVITVLGNSMLETGAMIFPYVLALASVFSFDSTLRKKQTEKQKTLSIVEAASALTLEEKKILCKIGIAEKNRNSSNVTRLIELILSASSSSSSSTKTSPKCLSIEECQKRLINRADDNDDEAEALLSKQDSISSIVELKNNNNNQNNKKKQQNNNNIYLNDEDDLSLSSSSASNATNLLSTVHPAVLVLTVFALSCASFLLNLIGEKMLQSEVLANAGNVPDVALVFIPAFLGFLACTGALLISHAWLGPALYKESDENDEDENDDQVARRKKSLSSSSSSSTPYVLWMPFQGGRWFILIQILGFSAFAAVLVQTVFCFAAVLNRTNNNNNKNNNNNVDHSSSVPVSLIPVAILSGIAPLLIALSSFFFVPPNSDSDDENDENDSSPQQTTMSNNNKQKHNRKLSGTVVEGSSGSSDNKKRTDRDTLSLYDNAEGIICLLVLLGGWIVSMFVDKLTPSEWASATAPLIIVSILITIAAPLGVVSLRKSARLWKQQQEQLHHHSSSGREQRVRKTILQNGQEVSILSSSDDDDDNNGKRNPNDMSSSSSSSSDDDHGDEDASKQLRRNRKKRSSSSSPRSSTSATAGLLAPPLVIVESAIVSLLCVLPLAVVYALYQLIASSTLSISSSSTSASSVGFEIWYTLQESTRWIFGLLSLGIVAMFYARGFLGVAAMYFGTYMMFLIPNMPYIIAVAFPLLRPNSISAAWVPIEFCISVPLPAHWIQPVLFVVDSGLLSISSRRLICLLMSSYQVFGTFTDDTKEMFCGNLGASADLPPHLSAAANYMFGSTILQALEHTVIFLLCVMYKFSFIGSPAVRGSHRSRIVEDFMRGTAIASMERFFNIRIFAEQSYVLEANQKIKEMELFIKSNKNKNEQKQPNQQKNKKEKLNFMFGFHPHGILAFTCAWIPISNVWRKMGLPRRVARFGASIIFNVPILRDAAMSMGARVVTKEAIHCALTESNETVSAMLVPGGQAEMLQSKPSKTEVYVKNHHKGFLRIALRKNKPAVPVYCFGEHDFMENVQMPKIQKFFLRLIGFGLPVVPMGALGILPLPRRTDLTIVVGKPIDPEVVIMKAKEKKKTMMMMTPTTTTTPTTSPSTNKKKSNSTAKRKNNDDDDDNDGEGKNNKYCENDGGDNLDESFLIDMFAEEYFAELKRIFYKYRAEAGYPDLELIFSGKDY